MIQYYDNRKTKNRETWSNDVLVSGQPVPMGSAHSFGFYPDSPQNRNFDSTYPVTRTQPDDDGFTSTLSTIAAVEIMSSAFDSTPSVDTSSSSDFSGGGGDFGGGGSDGSW